MLANFFMCGIVLVLRAVSNMPVRNDNPRGNMCPRHLMFSLPGPCEHHSYSVLLHHGPELW